MMVAKLLFPDSDRLINFIPKTAIFNRAEKILNSESEFINRKAKEYKAKVVYSIDELCKKFNIDYRK